MTLPDTLPSLLPHTTSHPIVIISPTISIHLSHKDPSSTTARKAVTMPSFKEAKCALTHVHKFVNALLLNGEIDENIKIAMFGNSLADATNYN